MHSVLKLPLQTVAAEGATAGGPYDRMGQSRAVAINARTSGLVPIGPSSASASFHCSLATAGKRLRIAGIFHK